MWALLAVPVVAELSQSWAGDADALWPALEGSGRIAGPEAERRAHEPRRLSAEVPVPACEPLTVDCGEDCELSGVYECAGYFKSTRYLNESDASYPHYRGWWVKGGKEYDTENGNHSEQFQIWFNQGTWRVGYTLNYWYLNSNKHDWGTSNWIPQNIGSKYLLPDFSSQLQNASAPSLRIIPMTTLTERDYEDYVRYFVWRFREYTPFIIASAIILLFAARYVFKKGKLYAIYTAPKGTAIFSDEYANKVPFDKSSVSLGRVIGGTSHETTDEMVSRLKEHEVAISGEQKGCVYVFAGRDGFDEDETYVVLQLRHCRCGPPLLPAVQADTGFSSWVEPADQYMHFSIYLAMTMERLTGENWSRRILPHIRNTYLVRYQAAVHQEDWRKVWDTLLKPFGEQQTMYRKHYRTKTAPEILFGVEAKPCEPPEQQDNESRDAQHGETCSHPEIPEIPEIKSPQQSHEDPSNANTSSTSATSATSARDSASDANSSSDRRGSIDGIPLPGAAAWLEFWERTEIPEHNTFVDFAADVDVSGFFRRVQSAPDLANLDLDFQDDFQERKLEWEKEARANPQFLTGTRYRV
jgi:hypothetical protein